MGVFFESAGTIAEGTTLLRIFSLGFPFVGGLIMIEQIHQGVGLNTPSMIFMIIQGWGLQVAPVLILVHFFGFTQEAIWWVLTLSAVVASVGFYLYYRRGRWLQVKV